MDHQGFCCDPAERPHLCKVCGKRYDELDYLERHYNEFHVMVKDEKGEWVFPRPPIRRSYSGPGTGSGPSRRNRALTKVKTETME